MSMYSATVSNTALPATTNDIMTLVPTASRRIQIVEISCAGMGTASSACQVNLWNITTAGTTGGGAITPTKFDVYAPSSATTVSTTWTGQPTVAGAPSLAIPFNANGGIYRWVARPGEEFYSIGGVACVLGFSIRPFAGAGQNATVTVIWMEDPM